MKRIDLHIHTVATQWDEDFTFDFEQLLGHIEEWELDVIAITNHNTFDYAQYQNIVKGLEGTCAVLPGVEASALGTHLLIILDPANASQLEGMCTKLKGYLSSTRDTCTLDELQDAFPLLDECIVIPHYEKDPSISEESLALIADQICACETSSLKKALRFSRLDAKPYPFVYFTDYRFGLESSDGERKTYRPGGVYVRTDSTTFTAIRRALKNGDVALSRDGSQSLELYPGITSTQGVNLILGKRSTGKTYTLERVRKLCDDDEVYYIGQGELVNASKEEEFSSKLNSKFSLARQRYLSPMRPLAAEMMRIGSDSARRASIAGYLRKLKKHADTKVQSDTFSNSKLFKRRSLSNVDCSEGWRVIEAVETLLDSSTYSAALDQTIGRARLLAFLSLVVRDTHAKELESEAVKAANKATNAVKTKLNRSSVDPYPDPILAEEFEHEAFAQAFASAVNQCWRGRVVANDSKAHLHKYYLVAERSKFKNATEVKRALGLPPAVSLDGITRLDSRAYIDRLLDTDGVADITEGLFYLDVGARDERGSRPSGGQRTECVFLARLAEAANKQVILIDEPESSFDNPFLDEHIAAQIRELGRSAVVFVTTHNQVLGFGLKPNKVFVTSYDEGSKAYCIHCDDMGDTALRGESIEEIPTIKSVMEILEAGKTSYEMRQQYYQKGLRS